VRHRPFDLLLVRPRGHRYVPASELLGDPELAAAFARGEADRAAGRRLDPEDVMALGLPAASAYGMGRSIAGVQAPPPIPWAVALVALNGVCVLLIEPDRPAMRQPLRLTAAAALMIPAVVWSDRAGRLRAERLGLTQRTAPRVRLRRGWYLQHAIALGYALWHRFGRGGAWAPAPGFEIARVALDAVERERAWRAALKRDR
jgi:hypothetical protein